MLLAAVAAFLAMPALAQTVPAPTPAPAEDLVKVALDTEAGRIVLALDRGRAPLSTANFLKYVDAKRYDGEPFYRAVKEEWSSFIQGGIRSDARQAVPAGRARADQQDRPQERRGRSLAGRGSSRAARRPTSSS